MSALTRRFLFSAACFLACGIGLGLWLLIGREVRGEWPAPHLASAHAHLLLVGAVMPTILGVALWLFPRPLRSDPQPPAWHGEAAWWCLTLGTAGRAVGEIARASSGAIGWRWLTVAGGLLQVVGLLLGVVALRPRMRLGREGVGSREIVGRRS